MISLVERCARWSHWLEEKRRRLNALAYNTRCMHNHWRAYVMQNLRKCSQVADQCTNLFDNPPPKKKKSIPTWIPEVWRNNGKTLLCVWSLVSSATHIYHTSSVKAWVRRTTETPRLTRIQNNKNTLQCLWSFDKLLTFLLHQNMFVFFHHLLLRPSENCYNLRIWCIQPTGPFSLNRCYDFLSMGNWGYWDYTSTLYRFKCISWICTQSSRHLNPGNAKRGLKYKILT